MAGERKRPVACSLVKVLTHRRVDRGMRVADFATRCVRRFEIHELATTDTPAAEPGDRVDRVGFVGFIEVERGGVVEVGDEVLLGERRIGRVLGFDDSHFPNHYNILVAAAAVETAESLSAAVGDAIAFAPGTPAPELDQSSLL